MSMGPDKAGRPTGPGDGSFLVTDQDDPRGTVVEMILTNFNIDGNMLKPEHGAALDEHIIPFLRANKVHVELIGTASKTGTAAYDKELSRERALRVRQYLLKRGVGNAQVSDQDVKAAGKSLSHSKNVEDELDRAVRVRIVVGLRKEHVAPHVVVPRVAPPDPVEIIAAETIIVVDTRVPWAIQELSGCNVAVGASIGAAALSVGFAAGTVEYHFLLVNMRTRQMAQCRFFGPAASAGPSGGGLKPGLSFGPSFSLTQGSHTWDRFFTPAGTTFESFEGAAAWVEAGLGLGSNISKCRLKFVKLGIIVDVSTGHTIGTPSTLIAPGDFHLKPPVQLQS